MCCMMGICNNCGNDKKYMSYVEIFRKGTEATLLVYDECKEKFHEQNVLKMLLVKREHRTR